MSPVAKRPPRKAAAPTAVPVPRMRAVRDPIDVGQPKQARPRRNRKPKFVF